MNKDFLHQFLNAQTLTTMKVPQSHCNQTFGSNAKKKKKKEKAKNVYPFFQQNYAFFSSS